MKEKKHKNKSHEPKELKSKKKAHIINSSSSSNSDSEQWVEKESSIVQKETREDWMAMTGLLKTYSKQDIKPPRDVKKKNGIDSYNPSTSSRELNPYWKDGGSGLPQTPESFRKARPFLKPSEEDDYYTLSSRGHKSDYHHSKQYENRSPSKAEQTLYQNRGSSKWKKNESLNQTERKSEEQKTNVEKHSEPTVSHSKCKDTVESKYLTDDKMNKLAAKIVKAEIMGNVKLANELKEKLETAREYRKQNPDAGQEEDNEGIMLISTNKKGNAMPLTQLKRGVAKNGDGKRKAETHVSGERAKYFGNDDKYNLAQMFQQEKYGNNYDDEAELAKIASKSKNPNDDLADIFMDHISKNRDDAKECQNERQKSINEHIRIERSLEGCEYCIDSKNMVKHMMISCGNKVYLALPSKQSLVKDHCLITTLQHSLCVTSLDEDVWEEILNYRKALTHFFNSQNKDVVFYETASRLHKYPHMIINCVPLPRDVGDTAPMYFKKGLLECEAEWSMNKKVVDLKGKSIRKGIPKGLPYFWVDFGMDPGFAHVIEDQQLFPKTFAEEIIAGILDLDHRAWKNPQREYGDVQRKKVLEFINGWKPFDPVKK